MTSTGTLNLKHSSFAEDFGPVDKDCGCVCCRPTSQGGLGITRAYIYHVASKETVGAHLYASFSVHATLIGNLENRLSMHNVHYLLALMRSIRSAIIEDRYPRFLRDFFRKLYPERSKIPQWAVNALRHVGVDLWVD